MKIYSIYDKKQLAYLNPFIQHNEDVCKRFIHNLLSRDTESLMAKFPHDYDLFEIGVFNDRTGQVLAHENMHHICILAELLKGD